MTLLLKIYDQVINANREVDTVFSWWASLSLNNILCIAFSRNHLNYYVHFLESNSLEMIHFTDDKMENWRHWGISKATEKISSKSGIGLKTPQIQTDIIFCWTVLSKTMLARILSLANISLLSHSLHKPGKEIQVSWVTGSPGTNMERLGNFFSPIIVSRMYFLSLSHSLLPGEGNGNPLQYSLPGKFHE